MRIIVIGATGTSGKAVAEVLVRAGHQGIPVSASQGERRVDIGSKESILALYEKVQPFDGLVCAAGTAHAGPLESMDEAEFYKGIRSKLMGQVLLVTLGMEVIRPKGFFTLTSGNLAEEPRPKSAGLGLVNGAINGFVINAALDLPAGVRLNAVSPSVLSESAAKYGTSPGRLPIPAGKVAEAYLRTVDENVTRQIIRAYGPER